MGTTKLNRPKYKITWKKILFALMLFPPSSGVIAEPVYAGKTSTYKIYVYPETLRKMGNKVKMWDLIDYESGQRRLTEATDKYYWSTKSLIEYDCGEEQSRLLSFWRFSEPKGQGSVLYSDREPGNWEQVMPDSIEHTLWLIACG